jgi:hypothetical protein
MCTIYQTGFAIYGDQIKEDEWAVLVARMEQMLISYNV